MGNCCESLCPRSHPSEEPEDEQLLLANPAPTSLVHNNYESCAPSDSNPVNRMPNRDEAIREIIKAVENRVVDACAAEVHPINNHEFAERSKFYSQNVSNRPVGSPMFPVVFPRVCTNPASALAAPSIDSSEVASMRSIAATHGKIMQSMNEQNTGPPVINFT